MIEPGVLVTVRVPPFWEKLTPPAATVGATGNACTPPAKQDATAIPNIFLSNVTGQTTWLYCLYVPFGNHEGDPINTAGFMPGIIDLERSI